MLDSLFNQHGEVSSPIVRGSLDLQDSLIEMVDGRVDLSPVFSRLKKKDTFYLRFEPIIKARQSASETPTIIFEWDPTSPPPVKVPEQGLYRIVLMRDHSSGEETEDDVWVLMLSPQDYKRHNGEFQQAVKLTHRWDANLVPDSRSFLRAYLNYLSRQVNISRGSRSSRK